MCTITLRSEYGRQKLTCATSAQALGEYLLRGLGQPVWRAVIRDGRGNSLTEKQLFARVLEFDRLGALRRKR